ncbi:Arylsulfatase [Planctomycetes bacterium Pla163]|uniref:Arylsulfatase n=2 Tax=Rohdeia mirabilis TaxID=2528008 RepID=A0A518D4R5_9BACT|nr:Arylsulfatase [Planctomycetes bacterium Pla163]
MVLVCVAALVGCGSADVADTSSVEPRWIDLTGGFDPTLPTGPVEVHAASDHTIELVPTSRGIEARITYTAAAWNPTPVPGLYVADLHVPRSFVEGQRAADQALSVEGVGAFTYLGNQERKRVAPMAIPSAAAGDQWSVLGERGFGTHGHLLALHVGAGGAAPRSTVHRVPLPLGNPFGDAWRIRSDRWSGQGIMVPPGVPQRLELGPNGAATAGGTADAEQVGTTRTLHLSCFAQTPFAARDDGAPTFTLTLDGAPLATVELSASEALVEGVIEPLVVEVPWTARELEIAYFGPLGLTGVMAPVLALGVENDAGAERRARARDGRPDLVLFVADTLRADALESRRVLRDSPTVTLPALADLARRSTLFDSAWSTSSWTLPTHASMFSGLLPRQHGAIGEFTPLAPEAETLAEQLAAAGYRTVAVTDGIYVSSEYGLDQGFEYFDQTHGPRPDPLARARAILERGDGRPTFLVVHSYAAHSPFQPSAESLAALGRDEPIAWEDAMAELERSRDETAEASDTFDAPGVRLMRDLYWGQALDFDGQLARFMDVFAREGWDASAVLVLTSDHGESFGEHGQMFHGGELYEAQTRIPFLVLGGERFGLEPGTREDTASLLDLAPTFAELAGVEPADSWIGRSLVTARDAEAWMSIQTSDRVQVAVAAGAQKLIAFPEEGSRRAFDLEADPDELAPLDPVPDTLLERYERGLRRASDALLEVPRFANPSAELIERLRAMGYLDDE